MTILNSILLMIASSGAYFMLKGNKRMRLLRIVMVVLFAYASLVVLLSLIDYFIP